MARKDNTPTISFFSFQDIITSVTGIMFLVMLILVLLLMMRNVADRGGVMEASPEVAELQKTVEQLRAQIAAASASSLELKTRIERLKLLDIKSIPARKQAVSEKIRAREADIKALLAAQSSAKRENEELVQSASATLAGNEELATQLAELQAANNSRAREQELLQDNAARADRMMRFTWKRSIAKKPFLVECSATSIKVGTHNSDKPVAEFNGTDYMDMLAHFMVWAKGCPTSETYFVLLVKPSAFEYAEMFTHILSTEHFDRGREVLPREDVIVFGGEKNGGSAK